MEKIKVVYQAGQSRYSSEVVDYMLAEVDGVELYAEAVNETWDEEAQKYENETATYDDLKAEILQQAGENGIDPGRLEFWYDE